MIGFDLIAYLWFLVKVLGLLLLLGIIVIFIIGLIKAPFEAKKKKQLENEIVEKLNEQFKKIFEEDTKDTKK